MKYIILIAVTVVMMFTSTANATLILNNNDSLEIGEFSINETFYDFYGYSENIPDSSNTGFELVNTVVFLIANFNNELALIGTFGSFVSAGDDDGGRLALTFSNEGFGDLLFVDDKKDTQTVNGNDLTINFQYIKNRTDGFIFGLGDGTNVALNLSLSDLEGIDEIIFLNDGSNPYRLGNNFSLSSTKVSEPSALALMLLGMGLLLSRKHKK